MRSPSTSSQPPPSNATSDAMANAHAAPGAAGAEDDTWVDPVVAHYMQFLDMSLIDAQLRRTPTERVEAMQRVVRLQRALRDAVRASERP